MYTSFSQNFKENSRSMRFTPARTCVKMGCRGSACRLPGSRCAGAAAQSKHEAKKEIETTHKGERTTMPKAAHKVVVIGHRNPDTDSICSAIAYAELKNKTSSLVCEPRRAGRMNQETEFVLKKFGVTPPRMCTDVNPKIRDVDFREMPGINGSTSLRKAWEIMRDKQIDTLPITDADNELLGLITVKDIATANMDVFDTEVLAKSRTSYKNILETLGGTMVVGDENAVCTTGHIKIGTATPEMLESAVEKGDIVILTNRYESQLCAIEKEEIGRAHV